jgi:uroporphyrinogen decarboxylase-like protein
MPPLDLQYAGPPLFAPIVFRLAMRIEQVKWREFAEDPTEAMFVLRAARKLFGQDLGVAWFDTWLEAEAAGFAVERDDLGRVMGEPRRPARLASVAAVLEAVPVRHAIEIVRRFGLEQQPVAGMLTGPATLRARLDGATADPLAYGAELAVALARAYCDAGAAALLVAEEKASPDLADFAAFAPVANLARYYGTPVILLSRHPLSPAGLAAADAATAGLFLTPAQAGAAVRPLPDGDAGPRARLAMSRWEVDPETPPEALQAWRHAVAA